MDTKFIYNTNRKATHCCCCGDDSNVSAQDSCCAEKNETATHAESHEHSDSLFRLFLPAIVSFTLLIIGLITDHFVAPDWFQAWVRLLWYVAAYLPVGFPVLKEALERIMAKDVFSEFFLMGLATLGAFAIGQYPEGVAVMLFYAVGEEFQNMAVKKAKDTIRNLLDQRPDTVTVKEGDQYREIPAKQATIGDLIQLKPGEKLALDGVLVSEYATFNTSALTGESMPADKKQGNEVLAGMINLNTLCLVKVTTAYADSKLSRILQLVQQATSQKAPTELFIRKFARIYTPVIVALSVAICIVPALIVADYQFSEWLYRALIFMVLSCPCALVISIPLGYFGGIGAASRHGILVKGSTYLDTLARVETVVADKTGTMTEGVFQVQDVVIQPEFDRDRILNMVQALEQKSTHPLATAINHYVGSVDASIQFAEVEEIAGYGLRAVIDGKELLAGNMKLLDRYSVLYKTDGISDGVTLIGIAYDKKFAGYISVADQIRTDSQAAITQLKEMHVDVMMLSGDKNSVVQQVAQKLGIAIAYGDLLPEDKVDKLKQLKSEQKIVAFVGDGVNDAPVLALSDVGVAMGGLGSDAAIETADVVIQDDQPSKIATAIRIGKATKHIVWQNIVLAFGVKLIVLLLGAGGMATMWEAVFADVGVALLAILNAIRIQKKQF